MRTFAMLALLAATTAAANAQHRTQTSAGKPSLTIGAGMVFKPEYSGADTYDSTPIPMISASKEITPGNTIYLRGLEAGLSHAFNEKFSAGAVVNYRFERDSSDSSMLS